MTSRSHQGQSASSSPKAAATKAALSKLALATCVTLALAGCRDPFDAGTKVAAWNIVDHGQRHAILVDKKPANLSLSISRGAYGLSPAQRASLIGFLGRYKAQDAGNSKLFVKAPSGTPNEVAVMHAVHEIRKIVSESGFDAADVQVEAYHDPDSNQPPVHVSYLRYVAEGPTCGDWRQDLGNTSNNIAYPDFGCADQANFAALVANPADLLGPRTQTPRPSQVRDGQWDKFKTGESTVSNKKADERASDKGGN